MLTTHVPPSSSSSSTPYRPLAGGIDLHGDLDGAADTMDACNRFLTAVNTCVSQCCTSCCMACRQCLSALSTCCGTSITWLAKNGYAALVRPVGSGVAEFFKAKNGKYRLLEPAIDLTTGIVGNPFTVLVIDPFIAADRENNLHFAPFVNPIGRAVEYFRFLSNILNGIDVRQNLVAASVIGALTVYFGLIAAGAANQFCLEGFSTGLFNPHTLLDPIRGWQAVVQLMQGDPTSLQKILVPLTAYVGLVNGYAGGKKLATFDFAAWHRKFRADVARDGLERHIDDLAELDEATARQSHEMYQATAAQGKNWKVVDVIGRGMERLLKIPAHIYQAPSRNLWNITGAKAWQKVNGLLPTKEKVKETAKAKASACAKSFMRCLGRKTRATTVSEASEREEKKVAIPSFEEILDRRKKEYSYATAAGNRVVGIFTRDGRKDGRQTKLDDELETAFMKTVISKGSTDDFIPYPVLPATAPPPYDEKWVEEVRQHPEINKMLNGDFPTHAAPPREKYKLYHECVYAVYTGHSSEVAKIVEAHRPPPYAPRSPSETELGITVASAPVSPLMSPRTPK